MRRLNLITGKYLPLLALLMVPSFAAANGGGDLSFDMSLESLYFLQDSEQAGQNNSSVSATFQPKYQQSWDYGRKVFDTQLFVRADANDGSRSHGDIRELSWTHSLNQFEYKVGISREFWGAAESYPLIDVINQLDNVEELDHQSRLGQPMAKLSYFSDYGTFSGWLLPYFRERNYASPDSRAFSGSVKVNKDAEYYSSRKERHVDFAVRYENSWNDVDFGLAYFKGTQRDPVLNYDADSQTLTPFYDQVRLVAADVQWTGDVLIMKAEALHRNEATYGRSNAIVYGFEYTFFDVLEGHDLGLIAEHLYDSRGKTRTSFDNDLFLGLRYTFNNINATEILLGGFVDLDDGSRVMRAKLESRITDSWKYELIVQTFSNIAQDDLFFYGNRKDDFVRMNLRYYF